MSAPLTLENRFWRVEFDAESGALTLTDRAGGAVWKSPHPFHFNYGNFYNYDIAAHCRMQAETGGKTITIRFDHFDWWARYPGNSYRKPDPGPELEFGFAIELDGETARFRTAAVTGIDAEPCSVTFPDNLIQWECSETASLAIPCGFGSLFEFPRRDAFEFRYGFCNDHNGMPFYGVMRRDSGGIGVIIGDPFDQYTEFGWSTRQPGRAFCRTTWEFNRKFANYPRELRPRAFAPGDGYLELAKYYRSIVRKEGRFHSLREKIAAHPEVEKLVGAVIWKHNVYSQKQLPPGVEHGPSYYMAAPGLNQIEKEPNNWTAYEVFDKAHEAGFDRVCIYNTGWNRFDFDDGYPTRLPPNPKRGTPEEFRRAAEYGRSLSEGYIYSIHDNYRDCYADSPEKHEEDLARDADGVILTGGIWRGGRARLLCTSQSRKYAERDLPGVAAMLGRGSIYTDVFGCTPLEECHHPAHPQSRRDDAASRLKTMHFLKETFGSLATEGSPAEIYLAEVDLGAYGSIGFPAAIPLTLSPLPVAVPLWQLVYHDSVLNYVAEGGYTTERFRISGGDYLAFLALYGMLPTQFDERELQLSRELREAYTAEMVRHEYLTPVREGFRAVAHSVFGDGTEVVANFTDEPFLYEGRETPPHDFILFKRGRK